MKRDKGLLYDANRCVETVEQVIAILFVLHEQLDVLEDTLVHWYLIVVPCVSVTINNRVVFFTFRDFYFITLMIYC